MQLLLGQIEIISCHGGESGLVPADCRCALWHFTDALAFLCNLDCKPSMQTQHLMVETQGNVVSRAKQFLIPTGTSPRDKPQMELIVQVVDIRYNVGNVLLTKSASLHGYAVLVAEIEVRLGRGLPRDQAIRVADAQC